MDISQHVVIRTRRFSQALEKGLNLAKETGADLDACN